MYGKLLIHCDMKVVTGLHIGGSSVFSAIGAVDSTVVKDPMTRQPIAPGSSLKGKLRTLLARSLCEDVAHMPDFDNDDEQIRRLFGAAQPPRPAQLQFADAFVKNADALAEAELSLTEIKFENTIDRLTSVANPRQIERVIPGVVFGVSIAYDIHDEAETLADMALLCKGLRLLQMDYLGGHGSRGSGRVAFSNFSFETLGDAVDEGEIAPLFKEIENYAPLSV